MGSRVGEGEMQEIREVSIADMTEAYRAVMEEDWEGLKTFLDADRVAVVSPLTVSKDTALHVAIYSGNMELIENIIKIAYELAQAAQPPPLAMQTGGLVQSPFLIQNEYGNTALHEAAAMGNVKAAERLLECETKLLEIKNKLGGVGNERILEIKNKLGETPLYRAAAFGRTEMVEYLVGEVEKETTDIIQTHRRRDPLMSMHGRRDDSNSILHIAVHGEHFETALWLQKKDDALGELKDQEGRTCLHLLANMPTAYKSGQSMSKLKEFIYYCLPDDNDEGDNSSQGSVFENQWHASHLLQSKCSSVRKAISRMHLTIWRFLAQGWPAMDRIWKEKKRNESVMKLTKLLVMKDKSWEMSYTVPDTGTISFGDQRGNLTGRKSSRRGGELHTVEIVIDKTSNVATPISTPLLIASSTGIIEIVDEILKVYPQAVEHTSYKAQNILHVAIKHRQKDIFCRVKKMKIPMAILVRKIDTNGYTLLHHAAIMNHRVHYRAHNPSPVLQLQGEIRWFGRVQKIIPSHYVMHHDKLNDQMAQEMFDETHHDLHKEAQEWLKRTSESCSVIAVLIATVAFTAAYTVPGGTDDKTGLPILLKYPFFLVFTVLDIIALASSLTAVVMFLSILTSPFRLQDFRLSLPRKLAFGFTFLFLSVASTMLAFAATIVLEIHLKARWSTSVIYTVAFLPVTIFALLQFPLYAAFTTTMKLSLKFFMKVLPWNYITRLFKTRRSSIQKAH